MEGSGAGGIRAFLHNLWRLIRPATLTTVEIHGEQCNIPNGHYLHDLGSRTMPVQHRYMVAEPNLCLNLLGPLLIGLLPGGFISYPGLRFLLGERKTHHAQQWSGRYLRFSQ